MATSAPGTISFQLRRRLLVTTGGGAALSPTVIASEFDPECPGAKLRYANGEGCAAGRLDFSRHKASRSSPAVWYLCSRSFARALATIVSSSTGRAGLRSLGGLGCEFRMASRVSTRFLR